MSDTRKIVEIMSELNRIRGMCKSYRHIAKNELVQSDLLFIENEMNKLVNRLQVRMEGNFRLIGIEFDKCEICENWEDK